MDLPICFFSESPAVASFDRIRLYPVEIDTFLFAFSMTPVADPCLLLVRTPIRRRLRETA